MSEVASRKFIEVREVIRKKSPKLIKWIPSFLLKYLERTIHEDDINDIMTRFSDLKGLDFVDALIKDLGVNVELKGAANIPIDESVIFASNHPLGGLDGIAFMHAIGQYRKDVKFLVNDILMNVGNLQPLFIPVNKLGGQGKSGIAAIEEAYASDSALLVFPAGLVSRKQGDGRIEDLEWKKSFINKAKKYKKDIVPVYIEGKNSNFFYNFARLRQKIGLKANLEMLYLPDEMFSQRNQTVTIVIGKKISYTHFDQSKGEKKWAEEVKRLVYGMSQEK
ncbi:MULTISPECIES: 1-acyl-sn-glycerol-3-phosphate acyltransferase [Sphingobacterium]|uniref:1-acyl-sn-glycerol-3-phosphate acyltransferase n=2 Tax=Sphingobacterium TaxID=28453 RepID=A0ABW5YYV8_9SPHI|nr:MULTISPECIES: 1-acyl-sn-glycerol-3-phosphate acyltransferase [Sphingobacterium]MBB2952394.1 putative hemolysin [Sphingobacterium sp. JUb56]MCS3553591.1 putative hemolysin [Sphingobacterium sp. JUb21]MCW2260854.1 putative hemolysin [Sphingobacterium kitahiroshimense]NJI75621.1 glycerol acyltransferase [Sphingobacterium sp. B16(2022)]QQD14323.1 1-acyl-sn-glycerol-3-phosphate acyltransferase [Sphingobacterium sp. UDSM-2020]